MAVLENAMSFRSLPQSVRRVSPAPDISIVCIKQFNDKYLHIFATPVKPTGREEKQEIKLVKFFIHIDALTVDTWQQTMVTRFMASLNGSDYQYWCVVPIDTDVLTRDMVTSIVACGIYDIANNELLWSGVAIPIDPTDTAEPKTRQLLAEGNSTNWTSVSAFNTVNSVNDNLAYYNSLFPDAPYFESTMIAPVIDAPWFINSYYDSPCNVNVTVDSTTTLDTVNLTSDYRDTFGWQDYTYSNALADSDRCCLIKSMYDRYYFTGTGKTPWLPYYRFGFGWHANLHYESYGFYEVCNIDTAHLNTSKIFQTEGIRYRVYDDEGNYTVRQRKGSEYTYLVSRAGDAAGPYRFHETMLYMYGSNFYMPAFGSVFNCPNIYKNRSDYPEGYTYNITNMVEDAYTSSILAPLYSIGYRLYSFLRTCSDQADLVNSNFPYNNRSQTPYVSGPSIYPAIKYADYDVYDLPDFSDLAPNYGQLGYNYKLLDGFIWHTCVIGGQLVKQEFFRPNTDIRDTTSNHCETTPGSYCYTDCEYSLKAILNISICCGYNRPQEGEAAYDTINSAAKIVFTRGLEALGGTVYNNDDIPVLMPEEFSSWHDTYAAQKMTRPLGLPGTIFCSPLFNVKVIGGLLVNKEVL